MNRLAAWLAATAGDATQRVLAVHALQPVGAAHGIERYQLTADDGDSEQRFFVKRAAGEGAAQLTAEAEGLAALERAAAIRVPRVIALGEDAELGLCLILEWLQLAPLLPQSARTLGAALAAQHQVRGERFGWPRDNFIGASPQINSWQDDWLTFFRDQRLHLQLRLAMQNRYPSRLIDRGERLLADCAPFLAGHTPQPALLHGDLWAGNAAALPDGTPVVYDPACYYGDRETDLAMTELFGGFAPDFHAAYRALLPLADGYPVRRDLYNLYHVLNHANLFAGDYVRQSERLIDRLLAELG